MTAITLDADSKFGPSVTAIGEATFFNRYFLGLALFIALAFAQFDLRGMVDIAAMPLWIHLHAAVMVVWLGLLIVQPRLASASVATHRKLGWSGALLAILIVGVGMMAGQSALAAGIVPPFFSPAYFLALTQVEPAVFGALVVWAIAQRRRTDWHKRLMVGATILLLEPAFGRLLPMPLLGAWGQWAELAGQLAALAILARFDRRTLGRVHKATLASGAAVIATHVLVTLLAAMPAMQATALAMGPARA